MPVTEVVLFVTNLVFATFYFSQIISFKGFLHKDAFITSLLGTSAGTIIILLIPLLPESLPWMDIGTGLIVVIWLSLTKHYTQMSWLGSFAVASFGALLYMIVSMLVSAFVLGLLIIFGGAPAPFS